MDNSINKPKTSGQVGLYLSEAIFRTPEDYQAITLYSQHQFGTVPPKTKRISESGISFQDFIDWINKHPGSGDVVLHNDSLYIVGQAKQGGINASGKLVGKFDSGFISRCNQQIPYAELAIASHEDRHKFYETLRTSGLQYSQNTGKIESFYNPHYGDKIVLYKPQEDWIGIFKGFKETADKVELICGYNKTTKETYYATPVTIEGCIDVVFEPMTPAQLRTMNNNLKKSGKVWNDFAKRIEPAEYQVPKGKTYWYIDETLKIKSAIDKRDKRAADRIRCGNYCRSLEEAMEWVSEIHQSRERILAKPE